MTLQVFVYNVPCAIVRARSVLDLEEVKNKGGAVCALCPAFKGLVHNGQVHCSRGRCQCDDPAVHDYIPMTVNVFVPLDKLAVLRLQGHDIPTIGVP